MDSISSLKRCTRPAPDTKSQHNVQAKKLCSCSCIHVVYILDRIYHTLFPSFFPYTNRQHCQPSYWIHPLDSKARLHARRNWEILRPLTANRSLCLYVCICPYEMAFARSLQGTKSGNPIRNRHLSNDKLWEQECGMSAMSVSDRHVCLSLWAASASRMNPYATVTTRKLPSAESERTLERHLHDPRKILSIALFLQVVPSFLRFLSFQGFHFLEGVKGQCLLDQAWTCHHHWLLVGKTFLHPLLLVLQWQEGK